MRKSAQVPPRAGCCFIVPPDLLRELSRGQKVAAGDPHIFQETFLETVRLRKIREGYRAASQAVRRSTLAPAPFTGREHLFDCEHRTSLPGRAVPSPETAGESFQTVAETTGKVAEFYEGVFARNSIDDRGMDLVSSLNYGRNYQNAFWNGQQMVYGNGDGSVFVDFWKSPDVIGHELTHGVTQYESGLAYSGEAGALNESLSDCAGVVFNQWLRGWPAGNDEGWLVGAGIMGPAAHAKGYTCLRDMLTPGARHCLSPQPASYTEIDPTADVHITSGVPNHAFALFARAAGGNAWEAPIAIWYAASTGGHLSSNATIADFARSTIAAAARSDTPALAETLRSAWNEVKVPLRAV